MTARLVMLLAVLGAAVTLLTSAGVASAHQAGCPDSNPPDEIVLVSGSGQTAQLGHSFETSFQVKLANHNGCPVTGILAGVNITFDAPASGPSGVFSGSGWRETTVGTDESGVAIAPTFTANFTVGAYTVYAHSSFGDVQFSVVNSANGVAASISAAGGSGQTAVASRQYSQPLQALVLDASGQPVQNAVVSFSTIVGATGANAAFLAGAQAEATTNATGLAISPPLVANAVAGRFTAVASVSGVATVATFALDNHAAAQKLIVAQPAGRTATVGRAFPSKLRVRVIDLTGQPVEGQLVAFTLGPQASAGSAAPGPGATFADGGTQASAATNDGGWAISPRFMANRVAGGFVATATTPGSSAARFALHNAAGPADAIAVGAASGETTQRSTRFAVPLAVRVYDRFQNPVSGATVVFSAPHHGATGYFSVVRSGGVRSHRRKSLTATAKTNSAGVAVAPPLVANPTVGGYLVRVGVRGARAHATFALVNTSSP